MFICFDFRFIPAINRKLGPDDAMDTVKLAIEYKEKAKGIIVGLDLSGDPKVNVRKALFMMEYKLSISLKCNVSSNWI